MPNQKELLIDNEKIELEVDSKNICLVERHFSKLTKRDMEIAILPIPLKPLWLKLIIRIIRFYQQKISHRLGNRCVFDPSCSHYSEFAYRQKGFLKGTKLSIKRLYRCRPQNGGIDEITNDKG